MTQHIIIAIDGPSASGKGTLARKLAAHLGFAYLDTGALYRCVGKAVLDAGLDPADEKSTVNTARTLAQRLKPADFTDPQLRSDQVGQAASMVAKYPAVRQALYDFQKNFAHAPLTDHPVGGAVLDGRDIGTVICPDADVKLFVTASTAIRARRRYEELKAKGHATDLDTVLADMIARDERDSARAAAPLKPAEDAATIDTSHLDADEVMARALAVIAQKTAL